jgi:hypothetical protein
MSTSLLIRFSAIANLEEGKFEREVKCQELGYKTLQILSIKEGQNFKRKNV